MRIKVSSVPLLLFGNSDAFPAGTVNGKPSGCAAASAVERYPPVPSAQSVLQNGCVVVVVVVAVVVVSVVVVAVDVVSVLVVPVYVVVEVVVVAVDVVTVVIVVVVDVVGQPPSPGWQSEGPLHTRPLCSGCTPML